MSVPYELVRLGNGAFSVRSLADGETFHPVAGPIAEAETLYIRQLRLAGRLAAHPAEFVIWDVGLGAGGNALTAIRTLANIAGSVRIVSFDRTLDALRFALEHGKALAFVQDFEKPIGELLTCSRATFNFGSLRVSWEVVIGDFPRRIQGSSSALAPLPAPHAIFFDAFSPARNPEMWTLPLFEALFRCLDPQRPCSLATFSRSTMARVSLLLAGFFVGIGESVAGKEETTIAANALDLIAKPLDRSWLKRAQASQSAEPLVQSIYSRAPLSLAMWERLQGLPQFRS